MPKNIKNLASERTPKMNGSLPNRSGHFFGMKGADDQAHREGGAEEGSNLTRILTLD